MKTSIVYCWEDGDPSREFVANTVFALHEFIGNEQDAQHLVNDYRRVIQDNEFTEENIKGLAGFLVTLSLRALAQYERTELKTTPWRELLLKHSLSAREASAQLLAIFYERAPNIRRIDQPEQPAAPTV